MGFAALVGAAVPFVGVGFVALPAALAAGAPVGFVAGLLAAPAGGFAPGFAAELPADPVAGFAVGLAVPVVVAGPGAAALVPDSTTPLSAAGVGSGAAAGATATSTVASLPPTLAVPENTARNVCLPGPARVTLLPAFPPDTVTGGPMDCPPSVNTTEPPSVPGPVTVAVRVTVSPTVAELADALTPTVELVFVTATVKAGNLPPA